MKADKVRIQSYLAEIRKNSLELNQFLSEIETYLKQ